MSTQPDGLDNEKEKPPFFKNWSQMYTAVLALLLLYIVLFSFFTAYFN